MILVSSGSSGSDHLCRSASRIWLAPWRVTKSGRSRYCGTLTGPSPITGPLPECFSSRGSVVTASV